MTALAPGGRPAANGRRRTRPPGVCRPPEHRL